MSRRRTRGAAWRLAPLLLAAACGGGGAASGGGPVPEPPPATGDPVEAWLTTGDRSRLLHREPDVRFGAAVEPGMPVIAVDETQRFQTMVGFGASITDASAWLIQTKLTPAARDALMRDLFGPAPGIGLSFTRLTIGASDFSRSHYSFDDVPQGQSDPTLARFSIAPNRADVLPTVKQALAINPRLSVMASPWSAPGWMKTTGSLIKGTLRPEAYGPFAEYFRRYVEAYAAEGVPIWAITVQNEPHFEPDNYPGMRLDPPQRAKFVGEHLGPLFERSGIETLIFDWDHNWDEPESPLAVLADPVARKYISGVAWHCYGGNVAAQGPVHNAHPDKDAYFTECSGGGWAPNWGQPEVVRPDADHRQHAPLVPRRAALEPRARREPRPAHRGLRRLPRRRHHPLGDGERHAQRGVLRARARQPLRPAGRAPHRVHLGRAGAGERRLPQRRRLEGPHRRQHGRPAAHARRARGRAGVPLHAARGRGGDLPLGLTR